MDAQFVFMAESRWQMSDVANTWNGHHPVPYSVFPPLRTYSGPHRERDIRATPCRGISLMCLVRRKHFANILSSSGEIRNIYRLAQHITHLISILVLLLSSLDQCPMSSVPMGEREYWYNLIGLLSRPTPNRPFAWPFITANPGEEQLHCFNAILCSISMYASPH